MAIDFTPPPVKTGGKVVLSCQRPGCGEKFEVWRYRADKARFHSLDCANKAKKNSWSGDRRGEGLRISLSCRVCETQFEVKPYRAASAQYCGMDCKNQDKKRESRSCICGTTFVVYPSSKQKFCSLECAYAGRARSSAPELSLKPYLVPLGYTHTEDRALYFTNKARGRVRVPDYVNAQERKIIEVFGEYWHRDRVLPEGMRHETPEECVEWYRELGWDCRVVWVEELDAFKDSLRNERVS